MKKIAFDVIVDGILDGIEWLADKISSIFKYAISLSIVIMIIGIIYMIFGEIYCIITGADLIRNIIDNGINILLISFVPFISCVFLYTVIALFLCIMYPFIHIYNVLKDRKERKFKELSDEMDKYNL